MVKKHFAYERFESEYSKDRLIRHTHRRTQIYQIRDTTGIRVPF